MATIVSGAKYAVKIIPSVSAANKDVSTFIGKCLIAMSNILGSNGAMNSALFNGKINQKCKDAQRYSDIPNDEVGAGTVE
jgi:hypothetical protein